MLISHSNSVQVDIKNNMIKETLFVQEAEKLKSVQATQYIAYVLRGRQYISLATRFCRMWSREDSTLHFRLHKVCTFSNTAATRVNIGVSKHATS